jgi:uncharacterized protein
MSAFVIDAFEFCRLKERREGETAVAELPRLAGESVDQFGSIRWSLQGGSDRLGHPQMNLSVSGSVQLMCQRCLAPIVFDIVSESVLVLADDEPSADAIEALLDDDAIEVIVGSRTFNFADLIEDEALLALPPSPKHEVCPDKLMPDTSGDAEKKVSPFAVLKNLKRQ